MTASDDDSDSIRNDVRGVADDVPGIDVDGQTTRRNAMVGGVYVAAVAGIWGAVLVGATNDDSSDSNPTPTPEPTPTPTGDERIRQVVADASYDSIHAEIDEILSVDSIERQSGNRVIEVEVRANSYFDENALVDTGVSNAYRASRALYTELDDIAEVWTRTMADFTAAGGETTTEPAVEVRVNADSAAEHDWGTIEQQLNQDVTNFLDVVDGYNIHASVCQNSDIVQQCAG